MDTPLPHDVAIEGIEDALVGQLQGVVQHLLVLAALDLRWVSFLLRSLQLLLPSLNE